MHLQLVAIGLLCATASADPTPPAAQLHFGLSKAKVKSVRVDGKPATDWINDHDLRVSASGFKKVEVTYEWSGESYTKVQWIAFAPGVSVKLQDHNGSIIAAQLPGKRCGRVEGSTKRWVLCDGTDQIPVGQTFDLVCANPADLGKDHSLWIDSKARPSSPAFVPTLPGLYRARYQGGKISVSYKPSDCADSRALEP